MAGAHAATPPFLTKLYALVDDVTTAELISWLPAGAPDARSFTVHKPSEFARDVLPRHFKHNNFSSFVRQLNQYGFHKRDPDRWTFGHDSFRRGRQDLLSEISRRRPKPAAPVAAPLHYAGPGGGAVARPVEVTQQKAVVELGNYGGMAGVVGDIDALKRDKDLLVRELVVTRSAETKLKTKIDGLEHKVESLERSSKQMQAFIFHYFSKVLQPYNAPMTSRKRKRLPPSVAHTNGSNPDGSAALEENMALAAVPTGSSMETLLAMLQQMQMPSASPPDPGPAGQGPAPTMYSPDLLAESYAPALVQELAHDDPAAASPQVPVGSPTTQAGMAAAMAASMPYLLGSKAESPAPVFPGTPGTRAAQNGPSVQTARGVQAAPGAQNGQSASPPFLGNHAVLSEFSPSVRNPAAPPKGVPDPNVQLAALAAGEAGPGSSPSLPHNASTLEVLRLAEAIVAGPAGALQRNAGMAFQSQPAMLTPPFAAKMDVPEDLKAEPQLSPPTLSALATGGLPQVTTQAEPQTPIAMEQHGKMLDDILDMDKAVEMFPPLTDLPMGTDISALARQVEDFSEL